MTAAALAELAQNGPPWLIGTVLLLGSLAFLIKSACSGLAKVLREKTPQDSVDRVKVIELQLMARQAKRRDKYRRRS